MGVVLGLSAGGECAVGMGGAENLRPVRTDAGEEEGARERVLKVFGANLEGAVVVMYEAEGMTFEFSIDMLVP